MPFFPGNYSPAQVISLHIERLIIPLNTFPNLKSLHIVHDNEREYECLNMVEQVRKTVNKFRKTNVLNNRELTKKYFSQGSLLVF
jgi:hypothetical protein